MGRDWNVVRLETVTRMAVDLGRVPGLLVDIGWLGTELATREARVRRIAMDLVLGVGAVEPVAFRKSMVVGIGHGTFDHDGCKVPIEWRSANLVPLFPVFAGHLLIATDKVTIRGHYAPPFGRLGSVVDRALLGTAARATANVVLRHFTDALLLPVKEAPA